MAGGSCHFSKHRLFFQSLVVWSPGPELASPAAGPATARLSLLFLDPSAEQDPGASGRGCLTVGESSLLPLPCSESGIARARVRKLQCRRRGPVCDRVTHPCAFLLWKTKACFLPRSCPNRVNIKSAARSWDEPSYSPGTWEFMLPEASSALLKSLLSFCQFYISSDSMFIKVN